MSRSLHKQAVLGVYISCAIAPCHRAGSFGQRLVMNDSFANLLHTTSLTWCAEQYLIMLIFFFPFLIIQCYTLHRGDLSCSCFRLNSVMISTGASSSVSLNTVSLFKSALARKLPPKIPSLTGSDSAEEEINLAVGADAISGELDDSYHRGHGSQKRIQRGGDGDLKNPKVSPPKVTGTSSEQYTMDSYVEQVKTNYISGDASVLMFGATASRQVREKQRERETERERVTQRNLNSEIKGKIVKQYTLLLFYS